MVQIRHSIGISFIRPAIGPNFIFSLRDERADCPLILPSFQLSTSKQVIGIVVQEDTIIAHAGFFSRADSSGPNFIMSFFILGLLTFK